MINSIKTSFNVLKDNLIVVQPLILYMILIGFVAQPVSFSLDQNLSSIIAISIVFLFTAAFIAGWFYVIKLSIKMKDDVYETPEEKGLAQISLLKQFFTGVGDYFIPVIGMMLLYLTLAIAFSFLAYKFGVHYIGSFDIKKDLVKILTIDAKESYSILAANTPSIEKLKIIYWGAYFSVLSLVFTFVTLFLGAALLYSSKNPVKAFCENLVFLFKNFFGAIGLIIFLSVLNFFVSSIYVISSLNIILSIIALLLTFFYMTYHVVLIFVYYDEKTKDTCNSGTEFVG